MFFPPKRESREVASPFDRNRRRNRRLSPSCLNTPSVGTVKKKKVLTTGYWPAYKPMEVTLPPVMKKCTEVFRKYYDETTT